MALGGAAADRNITILLLSTGSATHLAFSTYCNKIDATFAATITPSTLPNYPTGSFGGLRYYIDIDLMNSAVSDEPYCLTMTTLSNAKQISLPIGAMVNQEGTPILATTNSMSLNLFELATNGFAPGTNSFDLTNPQTPQAWPIMTMSAHNKQQTQRYGTAQHSRFRDLIAPVFVLSVLVRCPGRICTSI